MPRADGGDTTCTAGPIGRHSSGSVGPKRVTVGTPTLSADQLTRVLDELDQPVDVTMPAPEDAGLEDLSEPQLRALLKSLEG